MQSIHAKQSITSEHLIAHMIYLPDQTTYLIQVKLYSDSSGVTDRKQDQYFITPSTVSLSLFFLFVAGPILLNLPLNPGF